MSGIKRAPADIAFSLAVREYANHQCENCGRTDGQMENSHFYGRRHRGLRWEPLNCACLCHTCHMAFTEDPMSHVQWFTEHSGEGVMEILRDKRNAQYKLAKGEEKAIAKHYRQEVKLIQEQRENGEEVTICSWY